MNIGFKLKIRGTTSGDACGAKEQIATPSLRGGDHASASGYLQELYDSLLGG
jgi:hypothetical protein